MSFFKNIFGPKKNENPFDFSQIGVDMHSHLVPGIDDGSKSMEESVELIRALKELGYKKLITTPHIMADRYKNTPEIILSGIEKLKKTLKNHKIDMEIEAAAEYLIDDLFPEKMKEGNLLTMGDNYILVELSYFTEPPNLNNVFFELQTNGYNIILAHPERYIYWHDKPKKYQDLYDRGIFLQLNINSLTGWYSKESMRIAQKLIDNKLLKNIERLSKYFLKRLDALKAKYSVIREIRGKGFMIGLELNIKGKDIVDKCLEKGLILNCIQEKVVRFLPPFIITKKDIDRAISILDSVFVIHPV